MEFRGDPEILAIFHDAGAGVDGERVRFEPGMCRRIIQASAPARVRRSTRAIPRTPSSSAATTPCSALRGVRRSCTTSTPDGATRRSKTFAGSCRSTTRFPICTTRAGHRLRAGGHPRQQAPPRHALPPHPLLRSSLHGGVHRRGAGAGCGGHGEDRVRRGVLARPRLPLCGKQHECAVGPRCRHVRLAQGLRAQQSAGRLHAVDPGRPP